MLFPPILQQGILSQQPTLRIKTIMPFKIQSLLHASIIVSDTERALIFYRDLLGMAVDQDRPDLGYPGAWLTIGDQQLHLLELPNPDPVTGRPVHGGRDRHIAFSVADIKQLQLTLESAGIGFTASKSGRRALFARDPDGNACEFIEKT